MEGWGVRDVCGHQKKNHTEAGGEDGGSEVVRVDLSLKARGLGPRGALGPGLSLSMGKGNCFSCSGNPPHSSVFVHLFCSYNMHVSYTNTRGMRETIRRSMFL